VREEKRMGRRKSPTLTEVELEFMQAIWSLGGEVTTDQVQEALAKEGHKLAGGSVRKMLQILMEKGYVERRRLGRGHLYSPLVSCSQARNHMLLDLLKRAFDGSAALMVGTLIESRAVRDADVKEISKLLKARSSAKGKRRTRSKK
jgi:predicted transcriptional regulator